MMVVVVVVLNGRVFRVEKIKGTVMQGSMRFICLALFFMSSKGNE